jgi:hypothetical protein
MIRYAIIRNARSRREVDAYLPDFYRVIHEYDGFRGRPEFVIEGRDHAGWTMDAYVIPRLASGLIWAQEVGLDHPIFKTIPVKYRERTAS